MKPCEKELQVMAEAIAGGVSESLLLHAKTCPACTETVTTVNELRLLKEERFATPLPSAASVWWKAALQKQQAAGRRARRPLIYMQRIGYAVALLSTVAIAVRTTPIALSLPPLLWVGLGITGITCLWSICTLYAWSQLDS